MKGEDLRAKVPMGVVVHDEAMCDGEPCPFHNPSNHHMVRWPVHVRLDKAALVERVCMHGVGHPDPDSMQYIKERHGPHYGTHGCDGCCKPPSPEDFEALRQRIIELGPYEA